MSARSYTRRQLMIEGRKRLPSGYLEVEYIKNTSSAYINTRVKAKATHKFEAVVNLSERIATGIFGAAYDHKPNCALLVRPSMGATRSILYYGGGFTQCSSMIAQKTKVTIVLDKGALTFNGNAQVTRSWGSYGDSTYNVHIFKAADLSAYCKMKLYSFKIWDDDALVHNYVPCINLNNKAGLYDLVTRTFYGSSSSSDFVAGKVIY